MSLVVDLIGQRSRRVIGRLSVRGRQELHLNAIFPPLDMALMEISRSRFKQSKNPIIIS